VGACELDKQEDCRPLPGEVAGAGHGCPAEGDAAKCVHAARWYSWRSPPSRSRRWTRAGRAGGGGSSSLDARPDYGEAEAYSAGGVWTYTFLLIA